MSNLFGQDHVLNRRAVFKRSLVVGASVLGTQAYAQGAPEHDHHTQQGEAVHDHSSKGTLAAAARKCAVAGDACMKHCIALISKGDASLVDCLKTVAALVPVAHALEKLATNNARRLSEMTKLAFTVAADCEVECRKHAPHHAQCKACQAACLAVMEQCKKIAAT